jgi:hypothetical protein
MNSASDMFIVGLLNIVCACVEMCRSRIDYIAARMWVTFLEAIYTLLQRTFMKI